MATNINLVQKTLVELLCMDDYKEFMVKAFNLRRMEDERYLLTFCAKEEGDVYFGGKLIAIQLFGLRGTGVDKLGRSFIIGGYGPFEFRHHINPTDGIAYWQRFEREVCFQLYLGLIVETLKERGFVCIGRPSIKAE